MASTKWLNWQYYQPPAVCFPTSHSPNGLPSYQSMEHLQLIYIPGNWGAVKIMDTSRQHIYTCISYCWQCNSAFVFYTTYHIKEGQRS